MGKFLDHVIRADVHPVMHSQKGKAIESLLPDGRPEVGFETLEGRERPFRFGVCDWNCRKNPKEGLQIGEMPGACELHGVFQRLEARCGHFVGMWTCGILLLLSVLVAYHEGDRTFGASEQTKKCNR